jgi:hypothetical protein
MHFFPNSSAQAAILKMVQSNAGPLPEQPMSPTAEFLDLLLREGRAVLREPPLAALPADALTVLQRAFGDYRLSVAGPPIAFDPPSATAAALVLLQACWFLVDREQPAAALEQVLTLPGSPRWPAEHLSVDLTLRYLPQVHRRARAHDPGDRLPALLADVLRRWPLSGVLADLDDDPLTRPAFGHAGLDMLYAERLACHEKPAWVPDEAGRAYLELVYRERGRDGLLRGNHD